MSPAIWSIPTLLHFTFLSARFESECKKLHCQGAQTALNYTFKYICVNIKNIHIILNDNAIDIRKYGTSHVQLALVAGHFEGLC